MRAGGVHVNVVSRAQKMNYSTMQDITSPRDMTWNESRAENLISTVSRISGVFVMAISVLGLALWIVT
jgi:hypothetical protein